MSQDPNDNSRQARWPEFSEEEEQQFRETGIISAVPDEMLLSDPADAFGYDPASISEQLQRYGLTPEVVGKTVEDIDSKWLNNLYKYQFFSEYLYDAGDPDGPTETAPIQWRTTVYTVGQPEQALIDALSSYIHGRQKTVFDTGEQNGGKYADYFTNWAPFADYRENVEGPRRVSPDEVKGALCVPMFELEIYDEENPPNLRGEARGYIDPFHLVEMAQPTPPQQERFKIGKNNARGTYEFQPEGNARRRLMGTSKSVFLDGYLIGNVQSERGTIEMRMEYASADNTYTYRGKTRHSRQWFIDQGIFHPNAIMKGGAVWKVAEDADSISLSSTKPDSFDPTPAESVDVSATGTQTRELVLTDDRETYFEVRADNKVYGALGHYSPPVTRSITEETTFAVDNPTGSGVIDK